jgi:hypothetical protein
MDANGRESAFAIVGGHDGGCDISSVRQRPIREWTRMDANQHSRSWAAMTVGVIFRLFAKDRAANGRESAFAIVGGHLPMTLASLNLNPN